MPCLQPRFGRRSGKEEPGRVLHERFALSHDADFAYFGPQSQRARRTEPVDDLLSPALFSPASTASG
jgi:hypothetical protein